jgi:predicted Rossmann fold nucleotide-binding protein DprA/Smf involved in DNA uptake
MSTDAIEWLDYFSYAWQRLTAPQGKDEEPMIEKIVSGGQTGVDRAGLDAALEAGIPVGGYCPKGRLAEDGIVPERYPLTELTSGRYASRTEKNVVESDGTLVLNLGELTDGTKATVDFAKEHGRAFLVVQLEEMMKLEDCLSWIEEHGIRVLNIAGPRESKRPGVYLKAYAYLQRLFNARGTV